MRAANWWAISPGAAYMGRPITQWTGGRPLGGPDWLVGHAAKAPTSATGRHGTFRLMHSAAAPGLNGAMAPVRERVPSGNSSSGTPSLTSSPAMPRRRVRMPVRSTGKALKNNDVGAALYHLSKK